MTVAVQRNSQTSPHITLFELAQEFALFLGQGVAIIATLALLLLATHFPRDSDRPLSAAEATKAREFYAKAYDQQKSLEVSPVEDKYAKMASEGAGLVKEHLVDFLRSFKLQDKRILDVGSGQGYLQDVVADYTGLDIATSVQRYYHKRFVLGSATSMPFAADTFDAAWSFSVLEHVPNPEAALVEIRRVVKDGGVLYLAPAWNCTSWAADGYDVRPYADFGVRGKLLKAVIPLRFASAHLATPPIRLVRAARTLSGRPTTLLYRRLVPNFQTYWEPDSDAVNSLDFYEMSIWFRSRGDECLTCERGLGWLTQTRNPMIIRIHKPGGSPAPTVIPTRSASPDHPPSGSLLGRAKTRA
jgi:SAM-dependent methyltransferase